MMARLQLVLVLVVFVRWSKDIFAIVVVDYYY
jgi:hypothetical protein